MTLIKNLAREVIALSARLEADLGYERGLCLTCRETTSGDACATCDGDTLVWVSDPASMDHLVKRLTEQEFGVAALQWMIRQGYARQQVYEAALDTAPTEAREWAAETRLAADAAAMLVRR